MVSTEYEIIYDNIGVLKTNIIMQNVELDSLTYDEKYIIDFSEENINHLFNENLEQNKTLHTNYKNIIVGMYLKRLYEKDLKDKPFLSSFKQASMLEAGIDFKLPYRIVKYIDENNEVQTKYKVFKLNLLEDRLLNILIKDFKTQNLNGESFKDLVEDSKEFSSYIYDQMVLRNGSKLELDLF